jgi:hypothetical protein
VRLPERSAPGSLEVTLIAFPSVLAELREAIDGMTRAPGGRFEHACALEELNVLAMRYLIEHKLADVDLTRRLKDALGDGYARLAQYECRQGGFAALAAQRGDPVLTAMALRQFHELATVYDLDPAIARRTAQWLRTVGQASLPANAVEPASLPADEPAADAYFAWALSECGQPEIQAPETQADLKRAIALGTKSDDPYVVALAAATAMNARDKLTGHRLLHKLAAAQAEDGHVDARHGPAGGGGLSLRMETTALAALAWLKSPVFAARTQPAVQWIRGHRQADGTFGPDAATVLALEALCQADALGMGEWGFDPHQRPRPGENNPAAPISNPQSLIPYPATLTVDCAGRTIARRRLTAGGDEPIAMGGFEGALRPGENRIGIGLTFNAPLASQAQVPRMPYLLRVAYHSAEPDQSGACPVRLSARLAGLQVRRGQTVSLRARLVNTTGQEQPMTVAIVGLPAGLEAQPEQLEALKQAGTIDFCEVRPRELVFYWRSLAPKREVRWQLDLRAALPGKYAGPPSRAYLVNTPGQKRWCDPLTVEITPD